MGGSGRVWRVCNFMTQIQPDPLLKKKFVTQPNPPSLKNQPNLTGRDGSGLAGRWVFSTLLLKIANSLMCLGMTEDSRLTRPVLPRVGSSLLEKAMGQGLILVASPLRTSPCPKRVNIFLFKIYLNDFYI